MIAKSLKRNYIGITGFTNILEVEQVNDIWQEFNFIHHDLMLGFLISPRNLDDSWSSSRYPKLREFRALLEAGLDHFCTLHIDSKNSENWAESLIALYAIILDEIGEKLINGVQVNVIQPRIKDLEMLIRYFDDIQVKETRLILQYSTEFLNLKGTTDFIKDQIKSKFQPCLNHADHLLIDPSRGRGISIDVDHAIQHSLYLDTLKEGIQIGFAGGLSPDNVFDITRKLVLARGFNFSLDVETNVRTPDDSKIDLNKVKDYFNEIYRALYGEKESKPSNVMIVNHGKK